MSSAEVLNLTTMLPLLVAERPRGDVGRPFRIASEFRPAGDQPQAIDELCEGLRRDERDQVLLGVTGSGKTFTMAHVIARTGAAGDHPGAEQDARGAALRRDAELFPGKRGRIFRLLLRLLSARSLCSAHRHLCREGIVAERRDRPDASLGDPRDPRAPRCRRRRQCLVHLWHRLGRDLFADDARARKGRPGQPQPAPGAARRAAVPAQRP